MDRSRLIHLMLFIGHRSSKAMPSGEGFVGEIN